MELRQDYMKTAAVQNYSIVIRDIPTDVDRSTVERYLSGLLGNESVAIHLVEDAKPYDKVIAEKDEAVFKVGSVGALPSAVCLAITGFGIDSDQIQSKQSTPYNPHSSSRPALSTRRTRSCAPRTRWASWGCGASASTRWSTGRTR